MEKDVIFKSKTFGGFDKKSVMEYIDAQNSEKNALAEQLELVKRDASDFAKKIAELEAKLATIEGLEVRLSEQSKNTARLEAANELLSANYERVSAESAAKAEIIAQLEAQNANLKADSERLSSAQTQLGAAMLDARLHSERLVRDATDKVTGINLEASEAIGDTASRITDLMAHINGISISFDSALKDVESRIDALVKEMNAAALRLTSGNSQASAEMPSQEMQAEDIYSSSQDTIEEASHNEAPAADLVPDAAPDFTTATTDFDLLFAPLSTASAEQITNPADNDTPTNSSTSDDGDDTDGGASGSVYLFG